MRVPSRSRTAPHLVDQLALAVYEQTPLFEVPLGSRTQVSRDTWRIYGPWPPAACAEVLLWWSDRGWLELVATGEPHPEVVPGSWRGRARPAQHGYVVLSAEDALRLLGEPDRWRLYRDDGLVEVARTRLGVAQDHGGWMAAGTP